MDYNFVLLYEINFFKHMLKNKISNLAEYQGAEMIKNRIPEK